MAWRLSECIAPPFETNIELTNNDPFLPCNYSTFIKCYACFVAVGASEPATSS